MNMKLASPTSAVITSLLFLLSFWVSFTEARSFTIDYERNTFLKDGRPYQYIAGSIHYFRVPSIYWRDRMLKAKAAGLNAIQTYIAWNFHNPQPDAYEFSGDADLAGFLTTAQEVGLDVILRPGPYICAEWEHGGLPWWLLKSPDIKIRTSDPRFMTSVRQWFNRLFPILWPFIYKNGGPVIMMQVENEYGSFYACDREYMASLRDMFRDYFGNDTVLFTTDGGDVSFLRCGATPGLYATVDFGPQANQSTDNAFAAQRAHAPRGPLVNSEFYTTWLDKFGVPWQYGYAEGVAQSIAYMMQLSASFNFYMFLGGTNFGYWAAGSDPSISGMSYFTSMTTSYDYDAPLSEAGDPRYPLYHRIREVVEQIKGSQAVSEIPPETMKQHYGKVEMHFVGTVFDLLDYVSPVELRVNSYYPLNFVELNFPYGFVLYEHVMPVGGSVLEVPGIADRGFVIVDRSFKGTLIRGSSTSLEINAKGGQVLRILVENMGRQNYWRGPVYNDFKGITSNVTVDGIQFARWKMYPIKVEDIFYRNPSPPINPPKDEAFLPSFYSGAFSTNIIADTFFDPSGWGKGQVFVNGNNVGRYWPSAGPQITLYVPKSMIGSTNFVTMFELERPGNCSDDEWTKTCLVSFKDKPLLDNGIK